MSTIQDIVKTNYPKVEGTEPISKTLSKMKNADGVIITKDGKYDGILHKRDISRTKISLHAKAHTYLKHAAKVNADETIETTAGLMLESDSYILPVFKDDKLYGMVTATDLLKKAAEEDFGDEPIDRYITTHVITIDPEEPVSKAMKHFTEDDISRLPVIQNNKVSGIITVDDILSKLVHPEHRQGGSGRYADSSKYGAYMVDKSDYLNLPVRGIMSEVVDIMPSEETVRSVVDSMFDRHYRGVIIGQQDDITGVVTKRDLLEPLATFTILEPMVIQFSGKLDQIKDFEKARAREVIQTNFEKYLEYLDNAYIYVRFKQHYEKSKGKHIIHCKMRLSSPRGMFIGTDEGWGYLDAINKASEAIDQQIRKKKSKYTTSTTSYYP